MGDAHGIMLTRRGGRLIRCAESERVVAVDIAEEKYSQEAAVVFATQAGVVRVAFQSSEVDLDV